MDNMLDEENDMGKYFYFNMISNKGNKIKWSYNTKDKDFI